MKPWLQSLCHVIFFQKKMTQNPYAFAYVVCVSVSVLRICFASEIDFTFFSRIFCKSVYYAPINVKPAGGGEGGGRAWGGDLTFFKNLPSNSLPTSKSFHSIATKFPHPGLHISVHPKAGPEKGTIKISPNKTLQLGFIYKRCCITKDTCSCYSCNYTF